MNGRIAMAGNNSDMPSVTSTAPGALLCSSVLCANSWKSAGMALKRGTTESNSITSPPLQAPTFEDVSALEPDDCVPTKRPPTTAAALESISSSTEIPKLEGSPDLSSSNAMKPGV